MTGILITGPGGRMSVDAAAARVKKRDFSVADLDPSRFSTLAPSKERFDSSPFAIGSGPFKIKGIAFRGLSYHFNSSVPGGMKALLGATKDPELRAFLGQEFAASASYDLFPLPMLVQIAADLAEMPFNDFALLSAAHQAAYDLRGIYKILLLVFSPIKVIERICRVCELYYNFGPVSARMTSDHSAEFRREEMPVLLALWYAPMSEGYLRIAVERTGAREVNLRTVIESSSKKAHGIALCTVRSIVEWAP